MKTVPKYSTGTGIEIDQYIMFSLNAADTQPLLF